jgi:hypothetical protein
LGVFKEYCQKNKINILATNSKLKASIIERFNRTLKEKIWRVFTHQSELKKKFPYNFTKVLDKILASYNNSYHRSIKTTPNLVNFKNENKIRNILYGDNDEQVKFIFKIGDYCRISKEKTIFSKGYSPNWEEDVYIIANIFPTSPPRYTIKDLENIEYSYKFYEKELQNISFLEFPYDAFLVLDEEKEKILVQKVNSNDVPNWLNKNTFLK